MADFVGYAHAAIDSARARDGKVFFSFANWDAATYALQTLHAERAHRRPYAKCLVGDAGQPGVYRNALQRPSITNLEFGLLTETAAGKDLELHFIGQDEKPIDPRKLRAALGALVQASRSDANRQALDTVMQSASSSGKGGTEALGEQVMHRGVVNGFAFDEQARAAIDAFQALIAGQTTPDTR